MSSFIYLAKLLLYLHFLVTVTHLTKSSLETLQNANSFVSKININ